MNNQLTIFTDGGSRGNPGPAAVGITVSDQDQNVIWELGKTLGVATNNEAEYTAIKLSLEWLLAWPELSQVEHITWKLDSKLVVEQLNRNWKIKEPRMQVLAQECWRYFASLPVAYSLKHVPRELNKRADFLVNQALDQA